jgi:hypothetical protein
VEDLARLCVLFGNELRRLGRGEVTEDAFGELRARPQALEGREDRGSPSSLIACVEPRDALADATCAGAEHHQLASASSDATEAALAMSYGVRDLPSSGPEISARQSDHQGQAEPW